MLTILPVSSTITVYGHICPPTFLKNRDFGSLKTSNEKKEKLLTKIISGEAETPKTSESEKVEQESEMSEWEKRLERLN